MFERLKRLFSEEPDSGEDQSDDLKLALAGLLFEVVWADQSIDDSELQMLKRGLVEGFGIEQAQVEALTDTARAQLRESTSIYPWTRLVIDRTSEDERRELVTQLWQVALADNVLDKYEEYMIRKIADLLYVSHADFIAAKLLARERIEHRDD